MLYLTSTTLCDSCSDTSQVSNWNVTVVDQRALDDVLRNITRSLTSETVTTNKCIRLVLTSEVYQLDIVRLMELKLGVGGGLIMMGVADRPVIECINKVSDLELLKNVSVSKVSVVMLDGLIFNGCPVPIVFEEVSVVVVKNCVFR